MGTVITGPLMSSEPPCVASHFSWKPNSSLQRLKVISEVDSVRFSISRRGRK